MKLTLYYAPIACSLVSLVTLHESGAEFEVEAISLKNGQQRSPDYIRINPKSKVPVLLIDGEPLTENVAILTWLANAFPARRLLPSDPKNSIKALSMMAWCASGIHPHLARINAPARFCDVLGTEESVRRLAADEVLKALKLVNAMLTGREWVFDHWTAVDAYFFWIWRRAGQFNLDLSAFPNYAAHAERMTRRESVKRALAFERQVQARAERAA